MMVSGSAYVNSVFWNHLSGAWDRRYVNCELYSYYLSMSLL